VTQRPSGQDIRSYLYISAAAGFCLLGQLVVLIAAGSGSRHYAWHVFFAAVFIIIITGGLMLYLRARSRDKH
jgi:hypothetical protein